MTDQQHEVLTTFFIALCGGGGWSFLLYHLHVAFVAPVTGA